MQTQIILNPWSDRGRAEKYEARLKALIREMPDAELTVTTERGHALALTKTAVANGAQTVVAAGGDGTVHEVVNGLMQLTDGQPSPVRLGVIPIGSGNDFAWGLGIPTDLQAAVQRLQQGKTKRVDLGKITDANGRSEYFDNNLGIGLDATVVIETERMTNVHGFMLYLTAVFRALFLKFAAPPLTAVFDGESFSQPTLFLAMGVGPRGGGGFLLTPDADQFDNRLACCHVSAIGRLRAVTMLGRAIRGTHVTAPFVQTRQCEQIQINAAAGMPIHIDGEIFAYPEDDVRAVTITSIPAAINVIT